jgi:flagellar hook-basal body complex protein FliE
MFVPSVSGAASVTTGGAGSVGSLGLSSPTAVGGGAGAAPAKDFGETLAQMISGAAATVKAGEATSLAGMQGQASVQQVVEAVMAADQSLQVAMSIRDKVVSAYLEISRMSI